MKRLFIIIKYSTQLIGSEFQTINNIKFYELGQELLVRIVTVYSCLLYS